MQFSSTMCSNKIEYEETRIAILRFLPTRYTFGFVALDSAMINAIICNPHLPHYTYDNAGNLTTETNPLGQISYDYTYYRVLNKRYSNMTGNNVTYTYGTSGTGRGRPIRITDGSGMYECQYDSLGNVTAETRTIALPNHDEVYRFRTSYRYDSWGRMLSMTYPDGEEVAYTYLWGGDLYSMHGTKGANHRVYVGQILYDTLGQRSLVEYGNGTTSHYTYDALHRLTNLKSRNGGGTLMQDIDYTYDNASNVTGIANSAGVVNTLGGGYGNTYQYDALHRLVSSVGGGAGTGTYDMDMGYTNSGRIKAKSRSSLSPTLSGTVMMYYGYCDKYQPHAVRRIYDEYNQKHYDFRWDASGNLGQVSYGNEEAQFESGRFMYWTEDNRMHVAVDEKYYNYYAYDYSGERRIKLTGDNSVLDVNADFMSTISTLGNVTLYPSAYMVLTDRGYTKHYYTGMERVAARIGDGGLDAGIHLSNTDSLHARGNRLFDQSLAQVNRRVLEANDVDCIMDGEMPVDELGNPFDAIPKQMLATVGTEYGEFVGAMHLVSNVGGNSDVYYYHGDHLGSASWITDASGAAVQHLQYLPYGERFVDQRTSGYCERFTFTGKERDEETGYGYFGARYMDHELMTMWLSVDPMADKYPGISPYAYCAWNPVKLIDPDGEDIYMLFYVTGNKGGDGMFSAAAETRKKELESIKGFNPEKDIVLMFELKDIGQMKDIVENAVNTYSEQYGRTAEVGVWSHAGWDGPIGSEPTTGGNALDDWQMTLNGWNEINFNWSENANMVFYGCNTGNDYYGGEWVGSFSRDISSLSNYKGVNVWGQQTSAYPSSSPYLRATNMARTIGYGYGIGSTYMVGGNAHQGRQSLWFMPGAYPAANRMNVYKNGRFVRSAFQNR